MQGEIPTPRDGFKPPKEIHHPRINPAPQSSQSLKPIRKPRPAQVSKRDDDGINAKDYRRNPRMVKVTYPWRRGKVLLVHFFKHQTLRALSGGTSAAVGRLSISFAASSLLLLLLLVLRLPIAPLVCFFLVSLIKIVHEAGYWPYAGLTESEVLIILVVAVITATDQRARCTQGDEQAASNNKSCRRMV